MTFINCELIQINWKFSELKTINKKFTVMKHTGILLLYISSTDNTFTFILCIKILVCIHTWKKATVV